MLMKGIFIYGKRHLQYFKEILLTYLRMNVCTLPQPAPNLQDFFVTISITLWFFCRNFLSVLS